jgi:class 3 adenylate cyclase
MKLPVLVLVLEDQEPWQDHICREVMNATADLDFEPSFSKIDAVNDKLRNLLVENDYPLIVADVKLLEGKGLEVLSLLRGRDLFSESKVIIYTGCSEGRTLKCVLHALHSGAFSYVLKGDDDSALQREVRRALLAIQNERNRQLVGNFVDVWLRRKLVEPSFSRRLREGCRVQKCILFCDMTDSTPFIKYLQSNEANRGKAGPVLREIFSWQAGVIQKHGGIIDKFIGDEVMAYFGSSLDENLGEAEVSELCKNAVNCGLEIRDGFRDALEKVFSDVGVKHRFRQLPHVKIGIHLDMVIWGILGSESFQDLTIITDGVIRAARIMQHRDAEKRLIGPGEICVTEEAAEYLPPSQYELSAPETVILRDFERETVTIRKVLRSRPVFDQVQRFSEGFSVR